MAKAKIKWNLPAFEEIRRLPEVDDVLQDAVDDVMVQVGEEHYEGGVSAGKSRSRGGVVTADYEGIKDNNENQSLLRALANVRVG